VQSQYNQPVETYQPIERLKPLKPLEELYTRPPKPHTNISEPWPIIDIPLDNRAKNVGIDNSVAPMQPQHLQQIEIQPKSNDAWMDSELWWAAQDKGEQLAELCVTFYKPNPIERRKVDKIADYYKQLMDLDPQSSWYLSNCVENDSVKTIDDFITYQEHLITLLKFGII